MKKQLTAIALFMAFLVLCSALSSCTSVKPLCRHVVLSQHAACVDAGYAEVETMLIKNRAGSDWLYHAAVRVKVNGKWLWAEQPDATFRLTNDQPPGMMVRRLE